MCNAKIRVSRNQGKDRSHKPTVKDIKNIKHNFEQSYKGPNKIQYRHPIPCHLIQIPSIEIMQYGIMHLQIK